MKRIAKFHKVSFEQFKESWDDSFPGASEEEIKEISIGQKVRQKFETSLEDVSDSKLKTIADFDKKYQLQTKEVVLVKTEWGKLCSRFNLIRPRLLRFQHQKFQKEMSFSQGRGSKSFCWKMEDN